MKVAEALRGVRRLYLETAPLIYYVEENPTYIARMDAIVEAIDTASIAAVSSVITLTEVLVQPLKVADVRLQQEYRDILLNSSGLHLETISARIAETAAGLRARYDLRTPDALHMATAIESGCDAFLTNDAGIKRVKEIAVLTLDEIETDRSVDSA